MAMKAKWDPVYVKPSWADLVERARPWERQYTNRMSAYNQADSRKRLQWLTRAKWSSVYAKLSRADFVEVGLTLEGKMKCQIHGKDEYKYNRMALPRLSGRHSQNMQEKWGKKKRL